jgi:hypothetical protein
MTWECISRSHDCKLDLVTIRENLTGDQNTRDILQPVVVPHFAKHPLACIYGWQRQAASLNGSDRLPSKWSHELFSITSHEPGFESDEACLRHARLSCIGSWTPCAKLTSGIATATTAVHPTTNWRDNTEGWGLHPSTWRLHPILNFEPLALSDSQLVFSKWNDNRIVHYELLSWLIKMNIFNVKTGIVIVWQFMH